MIGKKLVFIDLERNDFTGKYILETFNLNELRYTATKNAKKYGFIILITTLRISIKSSHILKNGYKKTKDKINTSIDNYLARKNKGAKEKEVSSFLKMVSDYKHRIRQIKHRIKEEEGIE
jgi:hypothetical protein